MTTSRLKLRGINMYKVETKDVYVMLKWNAETVSSTYLGITSNLAYAESLMAKRHGKDWKEKGYNVVKQEVVI